MNTDIQGDFFKSALSTFKEEIVTKLHKLNSLLRNLRVGNKSPTQFLKEPLCMGNLSPVHKILIERPEIAKIIFLTFLKI